MTWYLALFIFINGAWHPEGWEEGFGPRAQPDINTCMERAGIANEGIKPSHSWRCIRIPKLKQ